MIEQQARVVEVGAGYVWLEVDRHSACSGCQAQSDCGSAALSRAWGMRTLRTRAQSSLDLQVGDTVVIGLADGALLRSAALAYLLPLLLLLAGAILGKSAFAGAGEEPIVLCAAMGLGLGLLAVHISSRHLQHDMRFHPVILRRA